MFSFLFSGKLKVKDVLFLSSSRIFYLSLRTHFSEEVTYSSLTKSIIILRLLSAV